MVDPEKKEKVYDRRAKATWKEIRDTVMNGVLPLMQEKKLKNLMKQENDSSLFQGIGLEQAISAESSVVPHAGHEDDDVERKRAENAAMFCKLMYLFTLFLDGKEINMMLSDMVNKFDNIAGFLEVTEDEAFPVLLTENLASKLRALGMAAAPILREESLSERFERERTQCAVIMEEVLDTLDLLPLSPRREILEYRHIDGLRWKEISGKLDISHATCRRRYERGIDELLALRPVQARLAAFETRRKRDGS